MDKPPTHNNDNSSVPDNSEFTQSNDAHLDDQIDKRLVVTVETASPDAPRKRSVLIGVGSGVLASVLAVGGYSAFKANQGIEAYENDKPVAESTPNPQESVLPSETPATSETAIPTSSPSPSAIPGETATQSPENSNFNFAQLPGNVVENNLFETLTPEQQAEIKTMNEMSVADFRQLDLKQQEKFGNFIYDNNIGYLKYRLDQNGLSAQYKGANLETPEGLKKTSENKYLLLSQLKTTTGAMDINLEYDVALKASIIVNPERKETEQQNIDAQINGWDNYVPVKIREVNITDSGILSDGEIITNQVNPETGEEYQTRYRVYDTPLINGETRKDGVASLSITSSDNRYLLNLPE